MDLHRHAPAPRASLMRASARDRLVIAAAAAAALWAVVAWAIWV